MRFIKLVKFVKFIKTDAFDSPPKTIRRSGSAFGGDEVVLSQAQPPPSLGLDPSYVGHRRGAIINYSSHANLLQAYQPTSLCLHLA